MRKIKENILAAGHRLRQLQEPVFVVAILLLSPIWRAFSNFSVLISLKAIFGLQHCLSRLFLMLLLIRLLMQLLRMLLKLLFRLLIKPLLTHLLRLFMNNSLDYIFSFSSSLAMNYALSQQHSDAILSVQSNMQCRQRGSENSIVSLVYFFNNFGTTLSISIISLHLVIK